MKCEVQNVRMRIMLAARKLFAQQGFEATTVRQICKEAKSNLALVSYHFGGKESVFFSLFDTFFPVDRFCDEGISINPVEGIRNIIKKLVTFKLEHPEMVAIIQQEVLMNSPRLVGMSKYMHPVYNCLRKYLDEGRNQGVFQFQSIDNTMIFIMAVATFPSGTAFIKPLLTCDTQCIDSLLSDTMNFIFSGLGHREKAPQYMNLKAL